MNIIKKHYAIKQCKELDKLIGIQEDICKVLEIGYKLCVDFDCIVHLAKVYLKNDKHIKLMVVIVAQKMLEIIMMLRT